MHKRKYQFGGYLQSIVPSIYGGTGDGLQGIDWNNIQSFIQQGQGTKTSNNQTPGFLSGLFTNGGGGGITSGLGNAGLGAINSLTSGFAQANQKNKNSTDAARNSIFNTGQQIASSFGPIGTAVAAVNNVIDATGGFSDTSKGLGGKNDTLNFISSLALPGAGWFTKKTQNYDVSDALSSSSGYTGTASDNQEVADNLAGRKLIFGKGRANQKISDAKLKDLTVNQILGAAADNFTASENVQDGYNRDQLAKSGNQWQYTTRIGKEGIKIEDIKRITNRLKIPAPVTKFENGGKVNIIPDGALHSRKNNLDKIDPELEDVTKKGIPVITKEDGGNIVQHAEIEKEEIIFTKEVTDKLEEYRRIGTDEAAIEAGRLLAYEIMENTVDKTENILND